jgi:hypothetical protein
MGSCMSECMKPVEPEWMWRQPTKPGTAEYDTERELERRKIHELQAAIAVLAEQRREWEDEPNYTDQAAFEALVKRQRAHEDRLIQVKQDIETMRRHREHVCREL